VDHPLRTLLVTSASPDDGKSTIASNLAVTMSHNDKRVAIIDADLRRPSQHKIMKIKNREGLSSLFTQTELNLNGNLQSTAISNVSLLTSGSIPPNPAELLGSEKMVQILGQVRDQVDIVIIDSPPLLAVTDASILASRADGVLLVIKPQVSTLHSVKQAIEQLKRAGANTLGVVMNDVPIKRSGYKYAYYRGYYYSYYQYYYSDRSSSTKFSSDQSKTKKKPSNLKD
jgi:non-specific protein-tyrosine kinase